MDNPKGGDAKAHIDFSTKVRAQWLECLGEAMLRHHLIFIGKRRTAEIPEISRSSEDGRWENCLEGLAHSFALPLKSCSHEKSQGVDDTLSFHSASRPRHSQTNFWRYAFNHQVRGLRVVFIVVP